jgi:pimeloyl-ACP methyl ester carboxylesterase
VTLAVPHKNAFLANAARHPRQLRRSWYMLFFQLPGIAERALVLRDFALVDRLWRDWSPGFRVPDDYRSELKRCLAASLPAPIEYYRALGRRLGEVRRSDRRIEVPTLHLHGADDGCVGPELADGEEQYFAGEFRREVVRGAGHFLHLEDPAGVNRRILEWLTS